MPFVKVSTNVAKSKLPVTFMSALSTKLATILSKDPQNMNWVLEAEKPMSKVN